MKRNAKWVPEEGGVRGTWRSVTDNDGGGGGGDFPTFPPETVLANPSDTDEVPVFLTFAELKAILDGLP